MGYKTLDWEEGKTIPQFYDSRRTKTVLASLFHEMQYWANGLLNVFCNPGVEKDEFADIIGSMVPLITMI